MKTLLWVALALLMFDVMSMGCRKAPTYSEAQIRQAFLDGMMAGTRVPCSGPDRDYQIEAIRAMGGR